MNNNNDIDRLLLDFFEGTSLPEDEAEIFEWLNKSQDNKNYFNFYRTIWNCTFNKYSTISESLIERELTEILKKVDNNKATPKKHQYWVKVAAAILILVTSTSAVFYLINNQLWSINSQQEISTISSTDPAYIKFESNRGSLSTVTLPDGTKVSLNAGSSLVYNTSEYSIDKREVSLLGEGFFDVVTNPEKPFLVNALNLQIVATGTTFNVSAYPGEGSVTTTLETGKVHVLGVTNNNQEFNLSLQPKQTLVYLTETDISKIEENKSNIDKNMIASILEKDAIPAIKIDDVNTDIYTSWKDKCWIVENATLGVLARQLMNRYNVDISFLDEDASNYRFTGSFENETIEEVLKLLRRTTPIQYSIIKGNITIAKDSHRSIIFEHAKK